MPHSSTALALVAAAVGVSSMRPATHAESRVPSATLVPTTTLTLDAEADSNSPVVWELIAGVPRMFVFTSVSGWSTRSIGAQLQSLTTLGRITFETPPPHGVWMEAIVPDADGTWYGYYHNEHPAEECGETVRTLPRIGAARSRDLGATWEDLGVVLEAPPDTFDCASQNRYFVGGVGDFSVMLDRDNRYLYFFFSQYTSRTSNQGVGIARIPWAFRDRPRGRVATWWRDSVWLPARMHHGAGESMSSTFAAGTPIYAARDGWHDGRVVDAFWGPSVHWNTYLEQYVMLLNRAADSEWRQEGIYVAYSPTLSDPTAWSQPQRLLAGGNWYPQVVGIETGSGTDRLAGERARFFMSGRSRYFIQFAR